MRLPNVRLIIPTKNATLIKTVPEFVVPLYKAAWSGAIDDPHGNPIKVERISKHPRYDYCRYTYVDSINALQNRLFSQWSGSVRSDGRGIWESVYGDGSFTRTVERWAKEHGVDLEDVADATEEDDEYTPDAAAEDVRAVKGIGNARAEDLSALLQIKTVGHLAEADAATVAKACTISEEKAQSYIDAAQRMLLVDEED
jgi:hypothetical protein